MDLVGNVEGCDAIIIDDMVDTGGTLCEAARQLKLAGAARVFAFITHGLLSGPAIERITNSDLELLLTTDSIVPLKKEEAEACSKIKRISIGSLLAKAIKNIQTKSSISALWKVTKSAESSRAGSPTATPMQNPNLINKNSTGETPAGSLTIPSGLAGAGKDSGVTFSSIGKPGDNSLENSVEREIADRAAA